MSDHQSMQTERRWTWQGASIDRVMRQHYVQKPKMLPMFCTRPYVLRAASIELHAAVLSELCILRSQLEAFLMTYFASLVIHRCRKPDGFNNSKLESV